MSEPVTLTVEDETSLKTEPEQLSRGGIGRTIARGASWTTLAQVTPLVVNIVLTPHVIQSFGLAGYGVFLLANTLVIFLGTFDGGLGPSVSRYSAVYAGRNDRAANTRLVFTLFLLLVGLGVVLFCVLFLLAGPIMTVFNTPAAVRADGVFLLKALAVVLGVLQVRSLFSAQLAARQQYGWQSLVTISSYAVYAAGMALTVSRDLGLRGAAWTLVVQALFNLLLTAPRALRYVDRKHIAFMPKDEFRVFIAYAAKVQATGLTGLVNQQADTFIVAKLLTVSAVSVYGVGANFATQLRNVPMNVLAPMTTAISHEFGAKGEDGAILLFSRLQKRWVQIATGWCSVAVAAVYFGIVSWLGEDFRTAGSVAAVLTAAYALHMWTGPLTALLTAVGRPGLEVKYATVAVAVNIVLTIPLVLWLGIIGTVLGTGLGLVMGSAYYLRIVRTGYRDDLPPFFRDVPGLPAAVTVATVAGLELLARPAVPSGALGLLTCGLIAAPGFLVFGVALVGPRHAARTLRATFFREPRH